MASADVAFESADEIAEKLASFEEMFKHRYTEGDEGFRISMQRDRGSRWYQVPQMHPWPPHRPYPHRRRHGGYRHRGRDRQYYERPPRHYHDDCEGDRERGYHRWPHRSRSPYRPREMDLEADQHHSYRDRSPHYSHPYHHPRSPGRHHRSRDRGSLSPRPHHHLHVSPHRNRSRSKTRSPSHSPRRSPPVSKDDQGMTGTSGSDAADDKGSVWSKDTSEQEKATLSVLGGFGEPQEKVVPSESDVLAILSTASTAANIVTSETLRQAQKGAQLHGTRREKEEKGKPKKAEKKRTSGKGVSGGHSTHGQDADGGLESHSGYGGHKPSPHPQHTSGLFVSHGTTENVSQFLILPPQAPVKVSTESHEAKRKRRRKRKIVISDDEEEDWRSSSLTEDEPIDVVGTSAAEPFNLEHKSKRLPESLVPDREDEEGASLVLHLDRRYSKRFRTNSESDTSHKTPGPSVAALHTPPEDSSTAVIHAPPMLSNSSPPMIGLEGVGLDGAGLEREGGKKAKKKKVKKKEKRKKPHRQKSPEDVKRDEPLKLKITFGGLDPDTNT